MDHTLVIGAVGVGWPRTGLLLDRSACLQELATVIHKADPQVDSDLITLSHLTSIVTRILFPGGALSQVSLQSRPVSELGHPERPEPLVPDATRITWSLPRSVVPPAWLFAPPASPHAACRFSVACLWRTWLVLVRHLVSLLAVFPASAAFISPHQVVPFLPVWATKTAWTLSHSAISEASGCMAHISLVAKVVASSSVF